MKTVKGRGNSSFCSLQSGLHLPIEDEKGNLKTPVQCAQHGLAVAEDKDHMIKCQLNSNMARVLLMQLDNTNALCHMRWAKKQFDQMAVPGMALSGVVYGHLILALVRKNCENPEIHSLRSEYCDMVENTDRFLFSAYYVRNKYKKRKQ